jgi:hypothetical protein
VEPTTPQRGVIRNRQLATRVKDYSGLRYGTITPTDIDGFMEFGDKLYVIIEGKTGAAALPYGQRLALERLCDVITSTGRPCLLVICEHDSGAEDVDYAMCAVREYRLWGEWRSPGGLLTVRRVIDNFLSQEKQ